MAGDYTQMDHDLPDSPEFLAIIEATGDTVEDVFFRLFCLWRLVDRQVLNAVRERDGEVCGVLPKCGPRSLAARCGGTAKFWQAVADVTPSAECPHGWLIFDGGDALIPGWDSRFSNTAKRRIADAKRKKRERFCGQTADKKRTDCGQTADAVRSFKRAQNQNQYQNQEQEPKNTSMGDPSTDPTRQIALPRDADGTGRDAHSNVDWEEVKEDANRRNRRVGLKPGSDKDKELFLKVCYLVMSGKLAEHVLADSLEGIVQSKPGKPWAFLWAALEERGGPGFRRLLAGVKVPEHVLGVTTEVAHG